MLKIKHYYTSHIIFFLIFIYLKNFYNFVSSCVIFLFRIRTAGSAALNMAMVALGGVDGFYEFGIHAWDMAAGDLLVREAGGVVIDPAGNI